MQQTVHRGLCYMVGQFVRKQRWQRTSALRPFYLGTENVFLTHLHAGATVERSSLNNGRSCWTYGHIPMPTSSLSIVPLSSERYLHAGNAANWCKKEVQAVKGQVGERNDAMAEGHGSHMRSIAPSSFDKKILVWTGKYPSIDAVPPLVTDATLNWAKNKFRVYVNLTMAVSTFGIALVMIFFGRRRAGRGESVSKMNMIRHPNQYRQHIEPETEGGK